jgi:hypothetical protein
MTSRFPNPDALFGGHKHQFILHRHRPGDHIRASMNQSPSLDYSWIHLNFQLHPIEPANYTGSYIKVSKEKNSRYGKIGSIRFVFDPRPLF